MPHDLASPESLTDAVVIGAGVIGLSCALELAAAGLRVVIWTAAPPEKTTSNVAAAFWYPYRVDPLERVVPWAEVGYRRFVALAEDPETGVLIREAIEILPASTPAPAWASFVDGFRALTADQRPRGCAHAVAFRAPVVDMSIYLPWLVAEVERAGVTIEQRALDSLAPALAAARVVVNATGLGARALVDDPEVYPVRGQVVVCERRGLEQVLVDEHRGDITYIVPRTHDVILGGVSQDHVHALEPDVDQTAEILRRCSALAPALAGAAPIAVKVGLRPCRSSVRLESEPIGAATVIHAYGHGGAGVTLSWGCAAEVRARALRAIDR